MQDSHDESKFDFSPISLSSLSTLFKGFLMMPLKAATGALFGVDEENELSNYTMEVVMNFYVHWYSRIIECKIQFIW